MVLVAEQTRNADVSSPYLKVKRNSELELSSIYRKDITMDDLTDIYRIEKDMWARSLWEYVKCKDCLKVFSKHDIYGHLSLPASITMKPVSDIEDILSWDSIQCPCCNWDTDFIFGESYLMDVKTRHGGLNSYLSVLRDDSWVIKGFIDGYVAPFDVIYDKEFQYYYWEELRQDIRNRIEMLLWRWVSEFLLCPTAVGTEEKFANMYTIYNLIKHFFLETRRILWTIDGIYESVLWTSTHALYAVTWGKDIWITNSECSGNTHDGVVSDIFIHKDVTWDSIEKLEESLKIFLVKNKAQIRDITWRCSK